MEDNIFTVTPMSQRISLTPGQTYEGTITISNPAKAKSDFKYKAFVAPYNVKDASYDIDLISSSSYTEIANWVKIDEAGGTLKVNEIKDLHFTINVPENAPGGGQYVAIIVSQDNDSADSNESSEKKTSSESSVNNVAEIASLIYAEVDGEIKRSGEVTENNIPGFITSLPLVTSATIRNNGNIHSRAKYSFTVKNFFTGDDLISSDSKSSSYTETILPETTRHSEHEIEGLPMLGVFHVTQTIAYDGKVMSEEAVNVIVCPIWFMVLLLAVIASITTTIVLIIRKHKHHKHQKKQNA